MRLCTFAVHGEPASSARAGLFEDGRVFELSARTTVAALLGSSASLGGVERAGDGHLLEKVKLLPPVPRPGKIVATIVNTQGMLGGPDVRLDRPRLDMKAPSTVIGPGETIVAPQTGIRPEVELAAVIGRRTTGATVSEAAKSITGYTIINDVTAPVDSREDAYDAYRRDRSTGTIGRARMRGPLFRSKNHDTFCPMGPWLVTPDENPDWLKLRMTTRFNDGLVQDGSTGDYIFTPAEIASYVSGFLTLEPGDVVSCGSVGWAPDALGALDPTEFVQPAKPGSLALEIEGLGRLVNPVAVGKTDGPGPP